ncbi:MAG: PQQ-binding-like beta-propeller repeat protein [Candidatus Altiarchaeota archaeon]
MESKLQKVFLVLALALVLSSQSHAAKMEASLLWKYDVRVSNENLYVADLNGDGEKEVIADGPESGVVHVLKSDGTKLWHYGTGTYFYDSYATTPDDRGACLVIGMFRNAYAVDSAGKQVWRRSMMSADARSVYAGDINNDGYLEYIVGLFSGMKANFQLVDSNGDLIKEIPLKGREIPYVISAADINSDINKEILIGGASFSVNTVAENYELNPGKGNFYVYDSDGSLLWSTEDGVLSIETGDLNNDNFMEVLVGTESQVIAYSHEGDKLWTFNTGGQVYALKIADVDNDNAKEVIVGAGKKVFLLDVKGDKKWSYNVDTLVTSVDAVDFDGDNRMEIAIGSTTVEVVNDKGEKMWESDAYKQITRVIADDINNDGYIELVSGSIDGWIRVFGTMKYAKVQKALNYKNLAEEQYDQMNYEKATDYAERALMLYEDLSDSKGAGDVRSLLDKMDSRIEADGYYNTSMRLFKAGDYANASSYAEKANRIYRSIGASFGYVSELNLVIETYKNISDARGYYNTSMGKYQEGNYAEASSYALKAREIYTILNNTQMISLCEQINNDSQEHLTADGYLAEAKTLMEQGNLTQSVDYFKKAGLIYARLGDVNGTKSVDENLQQIEGTQSKKSFRTYGWILVVAVFALGILLVLGIVIYAIFKNKLGEINLILGRTESRKPESKDDIFGARAGSTLSSADRK